MSSRNVLRLLQAALLGGEKLIGMKSGDALKVLPVADDVGSLQIGDGTTDMDVKVFLGASGKYVLFDVGNSRLELAGVNLEANNLTAAEHAAGVIGTGVAPVTTRRIVNGEIITEIKIDLQGLASINTANDVIGLAAGGVAYIGRNVVANNGIIYKAEMVCLEATAGGDNDVNLVVNSSGTLEYSGAGGTTYGIDGGDWTAGKVVQNLVQGLTADHYFYLTAGTGDTAAAYTAGQFLIRLFGHPVLT